MIAGTCTAVALLAIDGLVGVIVLVAVWAITVVRHRVRVVAAARTRRDT